MTIGGKARRARRLIGEAREVLADLQRAAAVELGDKLGPPTTATAAELCHYAGELEHRLWAVVSRIEASDENNLRGTDCPIVKPPQKARRW